MCKRKENSNLRERKEKYKEAAPISHRKKTFPYTARCDVAVNVESIVCVCVKNYGLLANRRGGLQTERFICIWRQTLLFIRAPQSLHLYLYQGTKVRTALPPLPERLQDISNNALFVFHTYNRETEQQTKQDKLLKTS